MSCSSIPLQEPGPPSSSCGALREADEVAPLNAEAPCRCSAVLPGRPGHDFASGGRLGRDWCRVIDDCQYRALLNSAAWLHQRPSTFPLEAMARKCTIAKLALACLVAWRQHSRPESARCCPILLCRRRSCVFSFPVGRSRSRQVRLGGVLDMTACRPQRLCLSGRCHNLL